METTTWPPAHRLTCMSLLCLGIFGFLFATTVGIGVVAGLALAPTVAVAGGVWGAQAVFFTVSAVQCDAAWVA
jgi:hypothetical protein